jgi:hypothetical protein
MIPSAVGAALSRAAGNLISAYPVAPQPLMKSTQQNRPDQLSCTALSKTSPCMTTE